MFKVWNSVVAAGMCAVLMLVGTAGPALAQNNGISLISDAEIEHTIRLYAQPLFDAAGIDGNAVQILIVQDPAVNAFVAGGMNMFFNTGLLLDVDNASQLIGVMAHELGHVAGGHLIRSQNAIAGASYESILATVLGIGAALATGKPGAAIAVTGGGQQIAQRSLLAFSRTQEASADAAGMRFLDGAGWSAHGMLEFLEKLQNQELVPNSKEAEFLMTHPLTRERVDAVRAHVERSAHSDKPLPPQFADLFQRMRAKLLGFTSPQQALSKFRADDPAIPSRYGRAIALYQLGEIPKALSLVDQLIAAEPKNPFFQELKGQILVENGKVRDSLAPYRQSVKLLPESGLLHAALAHALVETGDNSLLDEALSNVREAVRQDPHSPYDWRIMATIYSRKGNQGMLAYSMAEESLATGDLAAARYHATQAEAKLPAGSPGWLRAQDIRGMAGKAGAQ